MPKGGGEILDFLTDILRNMDEVPAARELNLPKGEGIPWKKDSVRVYHGTDHLGVDGLPVDTIGTEQNPFRDISHFGTPDAAQERLDHLKKEYIKKRMIQARREGRVEWDKFRGDPEYDAIWDEMADEYDNIARPTIYPADVGYDNPAQVEDIYDSFYEDWVPQLNLEGVENVEDFVEGLGDRGTDLLFYKNMVEDRGKDSVVVPEGLNIRSPWAKKDELKKYSKDILAGLGLGAVVWPQEEAEAGPISRLARVGAEIKGGLSSADLVTYLKKRGVKEDEIKASGLREWLEGKDKKITAEDMLEFDNWRSDYIREETPEHIRFDEYILDAAPGDYRETVTTAAPTGGFDWERHLPASGHFGNPDYLSHVRSLDSPDRNLLFELQSDIHDSASRKWLSIAEELEPAPGYGPNRIPEEHSEGALDILDRGPPLGEGFENLVDEYGSDFQRLGLGNPRRNPQRFLHSLTEESELTKLYTGYPDQPHKKDKWVQKALERELDRAFKDDKALDFLVDTPPQYLHGDPDLDVPSFYRGESYHNKYYKEGGKANKALEKLAKEHNLNIEDVTETWQRPDPVNSFGDANPEVINRLFGMEGDDWKESEYVQSLLGLNPEISDWLEVSQTPQEFGSHLDSLPLQEDIPVNIKRVTDPQKRGGLDYEMYSIAPVLPFITEFIADSARNPLDQIMGLVAGAGMAGVDLLDMASPDVAHPGEDQEILDARNKKYQEWRDWIEEKSKGLPRTHKTAGEFLAF